MIHLVECHPSINLSSTSNIDVDKTFRFKRRHNVLLQLDINFDENYLLNNNVVLLFNLKKKIQQHWNISLLLSANVVLTYIWNQISTFKFIFTLHMDIDIVYTIIWNKISKFNLKQFHFTLNMDIDILFKFLRCPNFRIEWNFNVYSNTYI